MNPKMKSAIEKITLNDATFSNEVIEPTYVNFFYGKNGAGKSTIARTFKANDERLQWQAGKASTDYDVLVYDTDFINANLRNYGNLAGVFTVNETNIAIQEQVDTLNAERKKMGEEYNGHKAAIDQKQRIRIPLYRHFNQTAGARVRKPEHYSMKLLRVRKKLHYSLKKF